MVLQVSDQISAKVADGTLSADEADRFRAFVDTCNNELMTHPIIHDNQYCAWFAQGKADRDLVKHFLVQFSVFSNLFLIAQLMKVINAESLAGMRASKEILANELGVVFHKPGTHATTTGNTNTAADPAVVSTEGSIEGGTFRFRAAHFEWLLNIGKHMELGFNDLGKRRHGTPATLFFCDQLTAIYGNTDANVAEGASFAVENWAAAGFWKQLITGLESFREREQPDLPLAFFTWHDRIEDQHAGHVMDELAELFFTPEFDEEKFLQGGRDMLAGVAAFWTGLDEHRIRAAHQDISD